MSATAIPLDPTDLPAGPDRVELGVPHLRIHEVRHGGLDHTIHLLENDGLGPVLGPTPDPTYIKGVEPDFGDALAHVVIRLGGTDGIDEVHYGSDPQPGADQIFDPTPLDAKEILAPALETLIACRHALIRAQKI